MLRSVHRWPGVILAVLLIVLTLSGAALSVFPALERAGAPQPANTQTVSDLIMRMEKTHPAPEQIRQSPSGRITVWWADAVSSGSSSVDPATGNDLAITDLSFAERWLTDLHRSLFMGPTGRLIMALGAAAMLFLTVSGAAMVARRMGGWRRWFGRTQGPWPGRIHVDLARFSVGGLLLSSMTALWMTASTFSLLPDAQTEPPPVQAASGIPALDPARIPILGQTPLSTLREVEFPAPDAAGDVITLVTTGGTALIDPGTGAVLSVAVPTAWEKASQIIQMLHTGRGAAALGLILGLMALSVPALAVTGLVQWLRGLRRISRLPGNAAAGTAQTILLIASEGGSTWGFARTLRDALQSAGQTVHTAPLNQIDPARYGRAQRIIILAATYGDGDAPTDAQTVMRRIRAWTVPPAAPVAILGFGDRTFPHFCGFASDLARTARDIGWEALTPYATVNRQSAQDFAQWGISLGKALNIRLDLHHVPEVPQTHGLALVARRAYGEDQAPAVIMRFALPSCSLWQRLTGKGFPRFQAGDLLGILPEGSDMPRFYSLASETGDGFIEICVRAQAGGLCSGQLTKLTYGQTVRAFVRHNPAFRPVRGNSPLILIGAGTGIAPLVGFIRANHQHRPMYLWFGARSPESDFLYGQDLNSWQDTKHLYHLSTAFSRSAQHEHVQDRLRKDAATVASLISAGAQVMVCGGRDMAEGVRTALGEILAKHGESIASLKSGGRYVEDIF